VEEGLKGRRKKAFGLLWVTLIFFSWYGLIVPNRTAAEGHFWKDLGVVRIDGELKAPDFTLRDLNGETVSLEDYRGKLIFLNFWATWCMPCRSEMPSMERLYIEFKDRGFTMLAVDLREGTGKVKAFREKFKLSFPILLDSDGRVGRMYGVRSIPTTYLIDQEGNVIGGALGARDWVSKEALELIEHLMLHSSDSSYGREFMR
jgi:peroxiredoxin